MNKKQKTILLIGVILIAATLVIWQVHGGEILTKTQVQVETTTDLEKDLGVQTYEWVDKFVLGLDYAGGISAFVAVISALLIFLFRTKKKKVQ
jgi:hypothetical protein